jgi:hypothetical protein
MTVPSRSGTLYALGMPWEVGADADEIHGLLRASDAYQAQRSGSLVPHRHEERTRQLVASGAVHVLRTNAEIAGMFTLVWPAGADGTPGCRVVSMSRLAVQPRLLESGSLVGAQCVRKAIELSVAGGARVLRAEANPDLARTYRLLMMMGFEARGPVHDDGAGRRWVTLEKALRPWDGG